MLDTTSTIVQALVWTTLAGLLYAVWLRRETTARYQIDLTFYWQQVVQVLSWMWVLLAIGLVISLLIVAWPRTTSAAAPSSATQCTATVNTSYASGNPYALGSTCQDSGTER